MNWRIERAEAQRRGRPANWLARMVSYVRDGILVERIRLRLAYIIRDVKQAWWTRQRRRQRGSFVYSFQPGLRMRLAFASELGRGIFVREFESKERLFHNAFLRPGDVYLDVGANIGLFSLIAAQRVGPGGCVHAVEPSSASFRQLLENIELNGLSNVRTHQVAFSDRAGRGRMYVSLDGHEGCNSMARPAGEKVTTETVSLVTLDGFIEREGLAGKVTMVKIDVEGWETKVLAGGRALFSSPQAPVLQIEFTQEAAESMGSSPGALYQALVGLGYQLYDYDPRARSIAQVASDYVDRTHINLFAIKDAGGVQARLRGRAG